MPCASATQTSLVHICKHLIYSIQAQTVADLMFVPPHLAAAVANFVPFVASCMLVSIMYKAKPMCMAMIGVWYIRPN